MQTPLVQGLIPLVQVAQTLVHARKSGETVKMDDLLKMTVDGIGLIMHANVELNLRRREYIMPDLNFEFKQLC